MATETHLVKTGDFKVLGKSPVRHDGVDKVTGRAAYGSDIWLTGQLYGKVLRSPHAHANILSIDTSAAEAYPGVHSVITSADLPKPKAGLTDIGEGGLQSTKFKAMNMLATEKALYDGHAIAAVAASDPHTAEEAARLIKVEYEVLDPVMTARQVRDGDGPVILDEIRTMTEGEAGEEPSNVAEHRIYEEGDVAAGFAAADHIFENVYETATVHQGYIETHNASALWHEDGHLEVWCSSQGAFAIRNELQDLLQMPVSKIKVVPMEIGGGFGGKTTSYLELLAAVMSRKSGRPVKMAMDRNEVIRATGPTPGTWMRVKIGVTSAGMITAVQGEFWFEAGPYPGSPIHPGCVCAFAPYSTTNVRVDGYDVLVNKPHSHAYRAPGATMSEFAVETTVDEICEKLGFDPIEFRLQNASKEGDWRADGPPFPRVGNIECVEAIRDSDHWQSDLGEPSGPNKARGRGVASGFWFNAGMTSSASGRVNADGTVTLIEGSTDIGGTRTSVAMQMAEALGISEQDIIPIVGHTDEIAFTAVTGGSRVTFATGYAAYEAAREILVKMRVALAGLWDVEASAVEAVDGYFIGAGNELSFGEAAALLGEHELEIVGNATVNPTQRGASFTTHAADVEVDLETGKVEILRYTIAQDAGKAVYPPYVEGQMQGGVVQGIGWALNEGYWYDDEGRLRNHSLLDYRLPTSLDLPMIETIIVEVPNPGHPYGVRGVGESSIVPPPATIANAIFAATGKRLQELPMSPPTVQAALANGAS